MRLMHVFDHPVLRQAATDPVQPVRDYNIPIPPHKQQPDRENFPRRRRERQPPSRPQYPVPPPAPPSGHIDDYA